LLYRGILQATEPERQLYLAISDKIFAKVFALKAIELISNQHQVALIVVNLTTEEVVQWIN
jgi:hypothetical protein